MKNSRPCATKQVTQRQSFKKFSNSPWNDESAQTFAHLDTELHFHTLLEFSIEENKHIQK